MAILALVVTARVGNCEKDAEAPPIALVEVQRSEPIVFDKDIYPILSNKCTSCHDRDGGLAEGDLDLLTVESLKKGGKHGPSITAEKGVESLIVKLAGRQQKPHMPPKDNEPLSPEELSLIKAWIDRGAKPGENLKPAESDRAKPTLENLPPGVHPVYALAIDASGLLVAAGQGNDVDIYDAAGGKRIARLGGHRDIVSSLRFSPDGKWLAAGGFEKVLLWPRKESAADMLAAWGEPISIEGVKERVTALTFSPDSKRLAIGSGVPSASGEIHLWDVDAKKEIRKWAEPHTDVIYGLAFSPDGQWIASASADKFMKVHSVETGTMAKSFEGHTGHVLAVAWNKDGKQLATASADKSIKVWSFESGERIRSIGRHDREITSLEWLIPANQLVTSSGDRNVRLINPDDGKVVRAFGGAKDYLLSVAASPEGKRVAGGCQNGDVYVWNGEDGKLMHSLSTSSEESASAAKR